MLKITQVKAKTSKVCCSNTGEFIQFLDAKVNQYFLYNSSGQHFDFVFLENRSFLVSLTFIMLFQIRQKSKMLKTWKKPNYVFETFVYICKCAHHTAQTQSASSVETKQLQLGSRNLLTVIDFETKLQAIYNTGRFNLKSKHY